MYLYAQLMFSRCCPPRLLYPCNTADARETIRHHRNNGESFDGGVRRLAGTEPAPQSSLLEAGTNVWSHL